MFSPPNMSCVTCHVSHVTCHVSHVTCHMSLFFFFLFRTKWWSLSVEGLLSTGPTPSLVYSQKWPNMWGESCTVLRLRLMRKLVMCPISWSAHIFETSICTMTVVGVYIFQRGEILKARTKKYLALGFYPRIGIKRCLAVGRHQ